MPTHGRPSFFCATLAEAGPDTGNRPTEDYGNSETSSQNKVFFVPVPALLTRLALGYWEPVSDEASQHCAIMNFCSSLSLKSTATRSTLLRALSPQHMRDTYSDGVRGQ